MDSILFVALLGLLCLGMVILGALAIYALSANRTKANRPLATGGAGPRCPKCGTSLTGGAPEGLCPRCLLLQGIDSASRVPRVTASPAIGPAESQPPEPSTAAYRGALNAPTPAELAPHFPNLEIIELLGQGGMGAVYKARQAKLDRLVALKVLPSDTGRDGQFAERFNREARALAKLDHANIVGVHDFGEAGGFHYFIMEFVDGVDLRQLMCAGQLKPEQALPIIGQICEALQFAHEEGIVHRDIKPENILLDKKGRLKIADFGLAKLLGRMSTDFTLTATHQVMGTLHYMAPEQIERPQQVDHRADIYSLGVVFYEMLTGELPLGRFAPPSQKAAVDVRLDEVVLRALEKEPERRYQHASDVKTEVETIATRSLPADHAAQGRPAPPAIFSGELIPRAAALIARATAAPAAEPRQQVQGPAIGLLVAGFLQCVVVLLTLLVTHQLDRGVEGPVLIAGILQCVGLALGAVTIAGALRMLWLRSHRVAVTASILALVPYSLAWPLSLLTGIWAYQVLRRPEVEAAFAQEALKWAKPPEQQVRAPAISLLVIGLLESVGSLLVLVLFGVLFAGNPRMIDRSSPMYFDHVVSLLLLPLFLAHGLLTVVGAIHFWKLKSYRWAMTGCIVAMIPVFHLLSIGLPVGIWALYVLTRPEVKAAFARRVARKRDTLSQESLAEMAQDQVRQPANAMLLAGSLGRGGQVMKLRGWVRLAALLSCLWLLIAGAAGAGAWSMHDDPGNDPPFVYWVDTATGETFARWHLSTRIEAAYGRNNVANWKRYFEEHPVQARFDWGTFSLVALGPVLAVWLLLLGLPWAMGWVGQGFRSEPAKHPESS